MSWQRAESASGTVYSLTAIEEGYQDLAMAVIAQAVEEYVLALTRILKETDTLDDLNKARSLKKWFGSSQCAVYSRVEPKTMLRLIAQREEQVRQDVQKTGKTTMRRLKPRKKNPSNRK